MPGRPMNLAKVIEVKKLKKQGLTYEEIKKKTGIKDLKTLYRYIHKYDLGKIVKKLS